MAAEVLRAQYHDLRRLHWTREIETSQKKSLRLLGASTGLYPDLLVVYHITTLFLFKYVRQSLSLSPPTL